MRFRTHAEATAFVKALLEAKGQGLRELMTADLDSVPQWKEDGKTPPPALDGSRVTAVYMAYKKPTAKQIKEAEGVELAGIEKEVIEGRLVDVREVSDGTTQVLFTNGQRNANGKIPWRGPNVDKGILCYLAIDEGLGEPVADIIARVPQEMKDRLKAMKNGTYRAQLPAVDLAAAAERNAVPVAAQAKSTAQDESEEGKRVRMTQREDNG